MLVVKVEGVQQVLNRLKNVDRKLAGNVERGLKKCGLYLLRESQKIVPVQIGTLKSTGITRKISGAGFSADIIVSYGSGLDYAITVHESPFLAHGEEFNIKHAAEIAAAGRMVQLKSGRTKWKPLTAAGTAAGGMFPRKKEEQYKFLEKPMRDGRDALLRILQNESLLK